MRSFHSRNKLIEPFIGNFNVMKIENKFFGGWGKFNWRGKSFWLVEEFAFELGRYRRGTNWFLILERI